MSIKCQRSESQQQLPVTVHRHQTLILSTIHFTTSQICTFDKTKRMHSSVINMGVLHKNCHGEGPSIGPKVATFIHPKSKRHGVLSTKFSTTVLLKTDGSGKVYSWCVDIIARQFIQLKDIVPPLVAQWLAGLTRVTGSQLTEMGRLFWGGGKESSSTSSVGWEIYGPMQFIRCCLHAKNSWRKGLFWSTTDTITPS